MIGLYVLSAASFIWCALTIYLSYQLMYTPNVKEPDRNVAIATIVLSAIFCLTFLSYAYLRQGEIDAGTRIVQGFRWYDAMILFCLLTWSIMAITTGSLLLTYSNTDTNLRNVCIANIVISLVILLQYIVYLYVQEQIPEWCQELGQVQEKEYQRLRFRRDLSRDDTDEEYRSKRSQSQSGPQIIVVPTTYAPAPAPNVSQSDSVKKAMSAPATLQPPVLPTSVTPSRKRNSV